MVLLITFFHSFRNSVQPPTLTSFLVVISIEERKERREERREERKERRGKRGEEREERKERRGEEGDLTQSDLGQSPKALLLLTR